MIWYAAFTILGTVVLWCVHQNRRYPGPPSQLGQALDRDRLDSMIDVVREQAPVSHAWPPGTTTPPQAERLPAPAACPDCTWWYDSAPVYWPCPAHDPQFVSEWEGRLSL